MSDIKGLYGIISQADDGSTKDGLSNYAIIVSFQKVLRYFYK